MSNAYNERAQEELILAEAQIVRAKRKERDLSLSLNGLTLDEVIDEKYEQVLAHEEKVLAQENYVLKLRSFREENTKQPKGMSSSSLEEFVQGILSHFGLEEGEAIVFLDPKGERVALEEHTCLVSMLVNQVEEIEEQIAQMTAENSKEVLKKLTSLKEFIVENTENINIR
ncbi:hypothetical protein [Lactococcus garvieae]